MQQEGRTSKYGTLVDRKAQGGGRNERTRNKASELMMRTGHVAVPEKVEG